MKLVSVDSLNVNLYNHSGEEGGVIFVKQNK